MILKLEIKTCLVHILKMITKELVDISSKITIPTEYKNYVYIYLAKFKANLLNYNNNNYAIKLERYNQLFYGKIYSLRPIKLETFKAYIETNLANNFVWLFKSLSNAIIWFNQKKKSGFHL